MPGAGGRDAHPTDPPEAQVDLRVGPVGRPRLVGAREEDLVDPPHRGPRLQAERRRVADAGEQAARRRAGLALPRVVDAFEHEPAEDEVLVGIGELGPEAGRRPPAERRLEAVARGLADVAVVGPELARTDRHYPVHEAQTVGGDLVAQPRLLDQPAHAELEAAEPRRVQLEVEPAPLARRPRELGGDGRLVGGREVAVDVESRRCRHRHAEGGAVGAHGAAARLVTLVELPVHHAEAVVVVADPGRQRAPRVGRDAQLAERRRRRESGRGGEAGYRA